jgi:hypothetical protein
MARVVYSDTAQTDLAAAISFIHEYFESRELIELGERHDEEDEDEVVIWYIRSSKSDYSNIVYLDQSRTTE